MAFAIQEAHRRGIELHAWFNPFRAKANVKPRRGPQPHFPDAAGPDEAQRLRCR
ncbi:MAG: hypothetical protein ACLU7D_08325 [Collinsella sp.]